MKEGLVIPTVSQYIRAHETTARFNHSRRIQTPSHRFPSPGPVSSLEQAACERGQHLHQVVRSILFRLGEIGQLVEKKPG